MSGQERLPGRPRAALGCGLDAVVLEDRLDRVAGDVVAEALQPAPDSRVAPGRVLVRQAGHQRDDVRLGAGATGTRVFEPAYFLATSRRYQRRIVSGVTMPAMSPRRRRPSALPYTARRRRWSSVSRSRRLPRSARRTRFSSRR